MGYPQKTLKLYPIYIFFHCLFSLTSCSPDQDIGSELIDIGKFYSVIQVVDDGSGHVYSEAQLTKEFPAEIGSGDELYIQLAGADELWLSKGSLSLDELDIEDDLFDSALEALQNHARFEPDSGMNRVLSDFLFDIIYEPGPSYFAEFNRPEGTRFDVYSVTFSRKLIASSGQQTFKSQVPIPQPFDITAPMQESVFSRSSDEIELQWSNIEQQYGIQLTVSTICEQGSSERKKTRLASDEGFYAFSSGALSSENLKGRCSTTITVAKVSDGSLNKNFAGGAINGYQVRKIVLITND